MLNGIVLPHTATQMGEDWAKIGKHRPAGNTKTLTAAISASEQIYEDMGAFLPLVQQYTDLQELNARILNELIEKIVVHEKERSEDGTVTQQVDIYYKFIGYIDPAAMLSEALSPTESSDSAKPVGIII